MCDKRAYSKQKAKKMVRGIGMNGKQMRAYQCEKCFMWHLTSQVNPKR